MSEWIKCSERLPEGEGKYLTHGSYGVATSWFHNPWGGRWVFQDCDTNNDEGMDGFTVSNWMALPEPPEDA